MQTQPVETYSPTQQMMADAYRVHAFNTNYTRVLYPVVAQVFLWKTLRQMAQYPDVWQHVCTTIDGFSGGDPIAVATVTIDDVPPFSLHDILSLVSQMEFDLNPMDNTLYQRFTAALVNALVSDLPEDDVDRGVLAIRIYSDVAETMVNLLAEYLITATDSPEDTRAVSMMAMTLAETQAQCTHVFVPGLLSPGVELESLQTLAIDGVLDWLKIHGRPGTRMETRFRGVTVYNGIMLRSVFADMPKAEEYLLLSYHVASNPEYRQLSQVDRDYIYFHTVVGKVDG